jgi:hypothetical protein
MVVSFMLMVSFAARRPSWAAAHPYHEEHRRDPTPLPGFLSKNFPPRRVMHDPPRVHP